MGGSPAGRTRLCQGEGARRHRAVCNREHTGLRFLGSRVENARVRASSPVLLRVPSLWCKLLLPPVTAEIPRLDSGLRADSTVARKSHVASEGDDSVGGFPPKQAWQSLERVNRETTRPGDAILLRSGDVWQVRLQWKGFGAEKKPIEPGLGGWRG